MAITEKLLSEIYKRGVSLETWVKPLGIPWEDYSHEVDYESFFYYIAEHVDSFCLSHLLECGCLVAIGYNKGHELEVIDPSEWHRDIIINMMHSDMPDKIKESSKVSIFFEKFVFIKSDYEVMQILSEIKSIEEKKNIRKKYEPTLEPFDFPYDRIRIAFDTDNDILKGNPLAAEESASVESASVESASVESDTSYSSPAMELINEAAKKFWEGVDPFDPRAPTNETVSCWVASQLIQRNIKKAGEEKSLAKTIASIIRHPDTPTGNKRAQPTKNK